MRKTFVERFDNGPCGWIGWDGAIGPTPVEIRDGMAISRSPWWVDCNHCHPGGGYLHILFALHLKHGPDFPKVMHERGGPNPYVKGGFPTNLTNAKVTVRLKGEVNLRGAQLLFHAQGNVPTAEPRAPVFHVRAGCEAKFERTFQQRFGEAFVLLRTSEVATQNLLGPEPMSPLARRRFGHYMGVAIQPATLKYKPPLKTAKPDHTGYHAALSAAEMRIPVIVV